MNRGLVSQGNRLCPDRAATKNRQGTGVKTKKEEERGGGRERGRGKKREKGEGRATEEDRCRDTGTERQKPQK
jgi:hypothetical protein